MLTPTRLHHHPMSLAALIAVGFFLTTSAVAQVKQYTDNKSDLTLRSEAHIDPSALGMSLEIPLGGAPGRAGASVPVSIRYSSKLWRLKYTNWWPGFFLDKTWTKPKFSENAWSGWSSSLDPPWIEYTGMSQGFESDGSSYSDNPNAEHNGFWRVLRIQLHLPDGSSHELRKSDAPTADELPDLYTGTFHSVDGSQLRFEADSRVLYLPDGSRYFFAGEGAFTRYNNESHNGAWASQYIDRNGNTINYSLTSVTDSMGRSQANPLTTNPVVGEQLYYVPGVLGQNLTYKLRWSNLADVFSSGQSLKYTSDTKCLGSNSYQSVSPSLFTAAYPTYVCAADSQFNPVVLKEVELPNGQKYQFTYNSYGEIVKIIYPTGGYERFDYGPVGAHSDLVFPYDQANRGAVDRWVSAKGDGTDEQHWSYNGVRITAPDNSYTERVFHGTGSELGFGFNSPLEGMAYEERSYNSSGVMMRRSLTEREVSGAQSGGYWLAKRDPRVIKQIQLLLDTGGNAQAAASTTQYDADLNPVSTNSYDYASINSTTAQTGAIGSISLGSLVRTQETTYLVNDTSISSTIRQTYRDRQLLGLLSSSRVKNSSGTIMAQSEVKYDEAGYAPITYGAVTGWTDPGTTVRGMATTMRNWLNPGGTWLETHAQNDQCGSPRKSWDALGKVSEMSYSSTYHYAYPTSTTSADPDGGGPLASLTSSVVYDFTSGAVNSTTDANFQTTSFSYDTISRLSLVTRPTGGGSTIYEYGSTVGSIFKKTRTAQDATRYIETYQYFDGLGRASRSFLNESGSYVTSDTQYDNLGRAWRTSNPYRTTSLNDAVNPSGLWMTNTYDALGRVLTVQTPDGAVLATAYSGNVVTVTDQAGKLRRSITDGLGRLSRVDEPNTSGSLGSVDAPNQPTGYAYDVLDNLTTVSQDAQTRTFVYDSLKRLTSAANPESGTITYLYDANGNLTKKTDARGVYVDYISDALNRNTLRTYSDGTATVTSTYDAGTVANSKGRLTSVSSNVSVTNYSAYDAMGRVTSGNQITDGQTYSMSYGYDAASKLISLTYPSGRVIKPEYDAAGRTAGVKDQASGTYYAGAAYTDATNRLQYAPHGAVSVMKLGNGLWEHTTFNNRLQPTQIGLGTSTTDSSTVGLSYTYGTTNNNGNVLTHVYAGGGLNYTQTFEYDELNRLTTSGEGVGSWSQLNKYDRYGNRWIDFSGTPSLTINAANNRITNSGYTYDAPGNLTNDSTQSFEFDAENKIKKVSGESDVYRYDADGNRVRKNFINGEKVRMVYSGGQLLAEYDLSNGSLKKEYVYGAKGLIATIEPSAVIKYTTPDHLGTPRVVTNSSAGVVSRHDYKPFGEEVGSGIGGRTTAMGYGATDGLREKFTLKERDIETGLDYFGARYYGSLQGRFTSGDPLLSTGELDNPQTWNRYSYALNSPLFYTDPSGMYVCKGSTGQCAQFAAKLAEARENLATIEGTYGKESTQYKNAADAVNSYGVDETGKKKNNGVFIAFDNRGPSQATTTATHDRKTGKLVGNVTVHFNKNALDGDSSQSLVAHEGDHVHSNKALGLRGSFAKEMDAFTVESLFLEAQHPGERVVFTTTGNPPRDYDIWNPSWDGPDKATLRSNAIKDWLAVPKRQGGSYELTPPLARPRQGKRRRN